MPSRRTVNVGGLPATTERAPNGPVQRSLHPPNDEIPSDLMTERDLVKQLQAISRTALSRLVGCFAGW
jgi:hypothetical protein